MKGTKTIVNSLKTAITVSSIQTLLKNDERLIYFFFSSKGPVPRLDSRRLLEEARSLPRDEELQIRAAIDIWCGEGGTHLSDLLHDWDNDNWTAFIDSIAILNGMPREP